mmetsp:Transcript_6077/g.13466  ORF Transcript_6077/g.13466 Transcript_6077/m.13466 type:complete len:447 (-) Transcript_6077:155-1495(-)
MACEAAWMREALLARIETELNANPLPIRTEGGSAPVGFQAGPSMQSQVRQPPPQEPMAPFQADPNAAAMAQLRRQQLHSSQLQAQMSAYASMPGGLRSHTDAPPPGLATDSQQERLQELREYMLARGVAANSVPPNPDMANGLLAAARMQQQGKQVSAQGGVQDWTPAGGQHHQEAAWSSNGLDPKRFFSEPSFARHANSPQAPTQARQDPINDPASIAAGDPFISDLVSMIAEHCSRRESRASLAAASTNYPSYPGSSTVDAPLTPQMYQSWPSWQSRSTQNVPLDEDQPADVSLAPQAGPYPSFGDARMPPSRAPPSGVQEPAVSTHMFQSWHGRTSAQDQRISPAMFQSWPGQANHGEQETGDGALPADPEEHRRGLCKPCLYWYQGLCRKGESCTFCHLTHEEQQIRRVRPSKRTRICLQRRGEPAPPPQSGPSGSSRVIEL